MKAFALSVKKFLVSEDGPTAVEYAVMLALIVIVVRHTTYMLAKPRGGHRTILMKHNTWLIIRIFRQHSVTMSKRLPSTT